MYLQRIIMPTGKVSWTGFDDRGSVVPEIREFVLYLEARHYAPSTVKHYAKHVVRLGNYLGAFGKGFGALTAPEFDRFVKAVVRHGDLLDADAALNIIPLRHEDAELSASLLQPDTLCHQRVLPISRHAPKLRGVRQN